MSRFVSTLLIGLGGTTSVLAQAPAVTLRYAEYAVTLSAPQLVLVFGLLPNGDLVQIYPWQLEATELPAGVTTLPLRRDGLWIVGRPPAALEVAGATSKHCVSDGPVVGPVDESMRSAKPCVEVKGAAGVLPATFLRPRAVLIVGTTPGVKVPDLARALAGFRVRGKAPEVAADLARALERAVPGSAWWSLASR